MIDFLYCYITKIANKEGRFNMIITILKRDGRKEKFELSKIENAIYKAAVACGGTNNLLAHELALKVQTILDQNTAKI